MSGYPANNHDYDDGYGHHQQGNTDSYYDNDQGQYYDNGYDARAPQAGQAGQEGYYDES
jgi:1,3-beta-glucan synthase